MFIIFSGFTSVCHLETRAYVPCQCKVSEVSRNHVFTSTENLFVIPKFSYAHGILHIVVWQSTEQVHLGLLWSQQSGNQSIQSVSIQQLPPLHIYTLSCLFSPLAVCCLLCLIEAESCLKKIKNTVLHTAWRMKLPAALSLAASSK